jgi:hypothetical protein
MTKATNKYYYLGSYNGQSFFRNTVTLKQVSFKYQGNLPEVGTVVTIIFGSRPRVIFSQPRNEQEVFANNIAIAMSNYGQAQTRQAYGKAIGKANRSYRNSIKYGYHI